MTQAQQHDRRAYFWLVIGSSGSGKTTVARSIIRRYARKPDFLVLVNSSQQLAEFARERVIITTDDLAGKWDARQLAAQIRRAGAIHFEVSPGGEPKEIKAFMDALGNACMLLGQLGTTRCRLLLVVDEASNYLTQETFSRGMRRVVSEGRKYGIDGLFILQQLTAQGGEALSRTLRRMVSVLVVCPMDERVERRRVVETWPELMDPGELAMPNPAQKRGGEYMVRDRIERRAAVVRVDPRTGRRYAVPLLRVGIGPPKGAGM